MRRFLKGFHSPKVLSFFRCYVYPPCLSRQSLPDLAGFEPSKADSKRSRTFREIYIQGASGVFGGYKKHPHFAFILLSTVQIARDIVRTDRDTFTLNRDKRTKN